MNAVQFVPFEKDLHRLAVENSRTPPLPGALFGLFIEAQLRAGPQSATGLIDAWIVQVGGNVSRSCYAAVAHAEFLRLGASPILDTAAKAAVIERLASRLAPSQELTAGEWEVLDSIDWALA